MPQLNNTFRRNEPLSATMAPLEATPGTPKENCSKKRNDYQKRSGCPSTQIRMALSGKTLGVGRGRLDPLQLAWGRLSCSHQIQNWGCQPVLHSMGWRQYRLNNAALKGRCRSRFSSTSCNLELPFVAQKRFSKMMWQHNLRMRTITTKPAQSAKSLALQRLTHYQHFCLHCFGVCPCKNQVDGERENAEILRSNARNT